METKSFDSCTAPHSITLTRNGWSRHYPVHPIYFFVLTGLLIVFIMGYFIATAYLVFRDNLITTKNLHTTQMLEEYEYRISNLRTNLDRVKSRQLMDQQFIESRVSELIERQKKLDTRKSALRPVLERASLFGLNINSDLQQPSKKLPKLGESISRVGKSTHDVNNPLFSTVTDSIRNVDANQKRTISIFRNSANKKLKKIVKLMQNIGIKIPHVLSKNIHDRLPAQIGGPFEPLEQSAKFSFQLKALKGALNSLAFISKKIRTFPLVNPVSEKSISSRFGPRIDPFKGKYAMHSGLDFKAAHGSIVYATANGKVTFSGRKGGYGKIIEIDHGNGYSTRYAHLSKILIKEGQKIRAEEKIGKVGNTGRSTGPHLHYEIRIHGKAVNPEKYVSIGRKIFQVMVEKKKNPGTFQRKPKPAIL